MFNAQGKLAVTLTTFGGLVTEADPAALPEGSSPLCWDNDFLIGSVKTRPGLSPIYSAISTKQNFIWVKSFTDNAGVIRVLSVAENGDLYVEDVTNSPGTQTLLQSGFATGQTVSGYAAFGRMYMALSPTGMPWQYDGTYLDRVSQEGPGGNAVFQANTVNSTTAQITAFSITSDVVTFTASNTFSAGQEVSIAGMTTGTYFNGQVLTVLSTGLSGTAFEATFTHADVSSTTDSGTATVVASWAISSITQPSQVSVGNGSGVGFWWSAGPTSLSTGNVFTAFYSTTNQDSTMAALMAAGIPIYVYLDLSSLTGASFPSGTYLVNQMGYGPRAGSSQESYWFTCTAPSAAKVEAGGTGFTYQITLATVDTATPVPGVEAGGSLVITGTTPTSWNAAWAVVAAPQNGLLAITGTKATSGVATYNYSQTSGSAPAVGDLVTITNCENGNGIFNVIDGVIASVGSGTFTLDGFPTATVSEQTESGQAEIYGSVFQIDPGPLSANQPSAANPIYGNSTVQGVIALSPGIAQSITAGTRQAVVIFKTRQGYLTRPCPAVTFTTLQNTDSITATKIPIGPPNVTERWIAFTEAGQEGSPGGFFYVIPDPVKTTVNNQTIYYTSTVIKDNITTQATFTFTDTILLSAMEIDVQGNDLFNMAELGSSLWCFPYADRLMWGQEQNKISNFVNMSFNGGYDPSTQTVTPSGSAAGPYPLGWSGAQTFTGSYVISNIQLINRASNVVTVSCQYATNLTVGQTVVVSGVTGSTDSFNGTFTVASTPVASQFTYSQTGVNEEGNAAAAQVAVNISGYELVGSPQSYLLTASLPGSFGQTLYTKNWTGATQSVFGVNFQPAYQDWFGVPIVQPNKAYSARVCARIPSGITTGYLYVEFRRMTSQGNFSSSLGVAEFPLSDFSSSFGVSSVDFAYPGGVVPTTIPSDMVLAVYLVNVPNDADIDIDHVEIYPTDQPVNRTQVRVSYAQNPEAYDLVTGNLQRNDNNQAFTGAFEMYDVCYMLKSASMYKTRDVANSEPEGWSIKEVSTRVGAFGPAAFDVGEEWALMACRQGIYVFTGSEPVKIEQEIWRLWEYVNFSAADTIWLRNDLTNRRIHVGVPMITPSQWLPNDAAAVPTSPSHILTLNYLGLGKVIQLADEPQMHTTIFGNLVSVDMRRKWSPWHIACPYADFVLRSDGETRQLLLCNGDSSGLIYELKDSSVQPSDNGAAIDFMYTTAPLPDLAKAARDPRWGNGRKIFNYLQMLAQGAGTLSISALHNTLEDKYPWAVPKGIPLVAHPFDDYERPLNVSGNRIYIQFTHDAVGTYADISRMILYGGAHPTLRLRGAASQGAVS